MVGAGSEAKPKINREMRCCHFKSWIVSILAKFVVSIKEPKQIYLQASSSYSSLPTT